MNTEKTKIIWIGRKKFSKDKLKVTAQLKWGETEFTLLGLHFSVNLHEIFIFLAPHSLKNFNTLVYLRTLVITRT